MTDDPSEPETAATPWTRRSPAVWAAARADYLAGGTAAEVCERHGLSLSTFRWRARTEGWRRSDQPPAPMIAPPDDEDDDPAHLKGKLPRDTGDLTALAWFNASRAMQMGRPVEARGWLNLYTHLSQMIREVHANRVDAEIFRRVLSIGRDLPDDDDPHETEFGAEEHEDPLYHLHFVPDPGDAV